MLRSADISIVIATRNRYPVLYKTLDTLDFQTLLPKEILIVDASDKTELKPAISTFKNIGNSIRWVIASQKGAAVQRNEGVEKANCSYILFMDDDVYLQNDVIEKLWRGIQIPGTGAVNAMISNQSYSKPGVVTELMYRLMSGKKLETYAGKLIGPAWNLLPEDNLASPEYVECDWLNAGCTLYKKNLLPVPVFHSHFKGYSLMEDVSLSFGIGKKSKLLNARTARIFHDSQPGDHKNNVTQISEMELVNRHYIMVKVMGRNHLTDYFKLLIFEIFQLASSFYSTKSIIFLWHNCIGKMRALKQL